MTTQKYTTECKMCNNIKDITEQINSLLYIQRKETIEDEIKFLEIIKKWDYRNINAQFKLIDDKIKQLEIIK